MIIKQGQKTKGEIHFKIYARFEHWYQRLTLRTLQLTYAKWGDAFLNKYGFVKKEWKVSNIATSAGKAAEAGLVFNTGGVSAFGWLAVGSSSTAPAIGQTALGSEIAISGLSRMAATISRITTVVANDTAQLTATWNVSGAGATVEEIGIFNAASVGIMLSRALTGTTVLSSGDQLQATYTFQYL